MADDATPVIQPSSDPSATAIAVVFRIAQTITANSPDGMRRKAALVGELADLIMKRRELPPHLVKRTK